MWKYMLCVFVCGALLNAAGDESFGRISGPNSSCLIPNQTSSNTFQAPLPDSGSFETYVLTNQNIIIFSYEDNTNCQIRNSENSTVWAGTLNMNQTQLYYSGTGVFKVITDKKVSVLVGDPIRQDCYGWYAVDQNNRAVSTKLLTYFTPNVMSGSEFIVFAYEDSTKVYVRNNATSEIIASGVIDSAEVLRCPASSNIPVRVEANKGVSALTYSDQGYWVPARNGTFSGRLFHTWIGNVGPWTNDLTVCSYYEGTNVKITHTEDGDILWESSLDDGDVHTVTAPNQLVTIESDKDVTCLVAPFTSYTATYYRLYIGMDKWGEGIGTKFYHPTISGAQLYIFSFADANTVWVYDQVDNSLVWSGTLGSGDYDSLTALNTVYRIESEEPVSIYDAWGDIAGADFAPVIWGVVGHEGVKEETIPATNEPSWFSASRSGDVLYVTFLDIPQGKRSLNLYDAAGRCVKSLAVSANQVLINLEGFSRGVYFVVLKTENGKQVNRKIVLN